VAATTLALLLGFASSLYASFSLASPAWRVALGLESQSDYLERNSQLYPWLQAINRATPPDAKIMVFGDEPRLFYLDRGYLLGNHAQIFSARDLASPDSLLAAMRRMGVTHLIIQVSTLQDMVQRKGVLETDLAGLEAEQKIRPIGLYGTLSLWQIADASRRSER
jgi:hypothetical protein